MNAISEWSDDDTYTVRMEEYRGFLLKHGKHGTSSEVGSHAWWVVEIDGNRGHRWWPSQFVNTTFFSQDTLINSINEYANVRDTLNNPVKEHNINLDI